MKLETTSLGPCAACHSEKPWNTLPVPKPKIIQAEAAILWARDIYFKHDIQVQGLRQKLTCLPDGTLIDGYTRFKILSELGIPILPYMVEIRDIPQEDIKRHQFWQLVYDCDYFESGMPTDWANVIFWSGRSFIIAASLSLSYYMSLEP